MTDSIATYFRALTKNLPPLADGTRKSLGNNAWVIALVCAILTGIAALSALSTLQQYDRILALVRNGGMLQLMLYLMLGLGVAGAVLFGMAIQPLQRKQKQGWNRLIQAIALWCIGALVGVIFPILAGYRGVDVLMVLNLFLAVGAVYVAAQIEREFSLANQVAKAAQDIAKKVSDDTKSAAAAVTQKATNHTKPAAKSTTSQQDK